MHSMLVYVGQHLYGVELRLILASWFSAIIGTIIYWKWQHKADDKSFKAYLKFTFPLEMLKHKDVKTDIAFSLLNRVMEPLTVGTLLVTIAGCSTFVYHMCTVLFGPVVVGPPSTALWLVMIIVVLVLQDFSTFATHYVEHKVPLFWEFHLAHHSPEFMVPLTNRRHNPLQLVWEGGFSNVLAGLALGLASYIYKVPLLDIVLIGTDAYYINTLLSFYHLRHSHIPLHYGWFEKWMLSPSNHQKHHSVEINDWDINFGLNWSIWDRLAGTWRPTIQGEVYRIGLPPKHAVKVDRFYKLWTSPFKSLVDYVFDKFSKPSREQSLMGQSIIASKIMENKTQ